MRGSFAVRGSAAPLISDSSASAPPPTVWDFTSAGTTHAIPEIGCQAALICTDNSYCGAASALASTQYHPEGVPCSSGGNTVFNSDRECRSRMLVRLSTGREHPLRQRAASTLRPAARTLSQHPQQLQHRCRRLIQQQSRLQHCQQQHQANRLSDAWRPLCLASMTMCSAPSVHNTFRAAGTGNSSTEDHCSSSSSRRSCPSTTTSSSSTAAGSHQHRCGHANSTCSQCPSSSLSSTSAGANSSSSGSRRWPQPLCSIADTSSSREAPCCSPQPQFQLPLSISELLQQLWDSLSHVKLLVAGASSALVSRTAVAPLERVKMEQVLRGSSRTALQTALWVWQHEGVMGFWKGNALNVLRTAPFKALNFFSFDMYSKTFAKTFGSECQSAKFAAGACAGITATLVCFPLDVLRTRIMAPSGTKYGGPLATLRGIVRHEGVAALYAGCVPAVIGMAPAGAVFYGVYDLLKAAHFKSDAPPPTPVAAAAGARTGTVSTAGPASTSAAAAAGWQHQELPAAYTLLYGALAGAAAEVIVYPLEVIRRKMQLLSMSASLPPTLPPGAGGALLRGLKAHRVPPAAAAAAAAGVPAAAAGTPVASGRILAACAAIIRANGVAGFYAGLLPNMLQVLPSASLSYFTYETVKHALGVSG